MGLLFLSENLCGEKNCDSRDFFFFRPRRWVEFLKMLNVTTSILINHANHWRVECLMWNEMTHLANLMSLYRNKSRLRYEGNFHQASVKYNKTIQTFWLSLKFLSTSSLSKIIKAGYAALQLEYFFTAGPDEVRAWTIRVRGDRTALWTHTASHVPPCWHPHWYHTLPTLSWSCFSWSLQAEDNFNYWWAAERWKWGPTLIEEDNNWFCPLRPWECFHPVQICLPSSCRWR